MFLQKDVFLALSLLLGVTTFVVLLGVTTFVILLGVTMHVVLSGAEMFVVVFLSLIFSFFVSVQMQTSWLQIQLLFFGN